MQGYKTITFNIVLMLPAILAVVAEIAALLLQDPAIAALLPLDIGPTVLAVVAAVNIILRAKTTTAIFKSDA